MSLKQQLAEQRMNFLAKVPEDIQAVMAQATNDLSSSGIVEKAPKVGDKLAHFELPNQNGEQRSLSTLLSKGPLVITFYRGGWCPYCNLELRAYQQLLPKIRENGATLVAITPELPDSSLSTAEKNGLEFEVLTDKNGAYARELGLL